MTVLLETNAAARAELGLASANSCRQSEERVPARWADPLDGARARFAHLDRWLTEFNAATISDSRPMRVAVVAGRHKIAGGIICPVMVKMVDKDRACDKSSPRHPVDLVSAPMARMRPWADVVIQYDPRNGECPTGGRKGMVYDFPSSPCKYGLPDRSSLRLPVTRTAAVLPFEVRVTVERLPTRAADDVHPADSTAKPEGS